MVLSNETILTKQYVHDRGPGWGISGAKTPEAETYLAFRHSVEAANMLAFQYLEMQRNHRYLQSALCMIQDHFPWLFQK